MKCSDILYEMVAINNKMLKSSTGESYLSAMAAINKMISKGNDENYLFISTFPAGPLLFTHDNTELGHKHEGDV